MTPNQFSTALQIINLVAHYYGVYPGELEQPRRGEERITWPRQVSMFLLRDRGLPFQSIATLLNRRAHSTVQQACQHVRNRCDTEPTTRAELDLIRSSVPLWLSSVPNP